MSYVLYFFGGLFLCNCIPHLVSGLRGEPFQSPFAKPPGVGLSPPSTNFLWGWANLVVGLILTRSAAGLAFSPPRVMLMVGFLVCGWSLSRHFGKVRQAG